MRIGIDARFLTHPQVGGFKTYTTNLLTALLALGQDNEYVIYIDRQPEIELFNSSYVTYRVVEATLPVVGMPYREQVSLRRRIEQDRLDMVHFLCNTAPVGITTPFIVTLHDTIQVSEPNPFRLFSRHKGWAMMAYSKWSILKTVHAARKVITVSNFEKRLIIEQLGVEPDRVRVTHLGPNPVFKPADEATRARWRTELAQTMNLPRRYIMGVGYEERKNIPLLIEAFAAIAPSQPDLHLVVVSAQPDRRIYFQQLAAAKKLAERILILPGVTPDMLAKLYNLTALFLFPSVRESFGLPPLEALACGAPTIAMNMTSIPEIMQDGAVLIDDADTQTWASVMNQYLKDDIGRAALAQRGLARAAQLTWQRCAEETIDVYQAALR